MTGQDQATTGPEGGQAILAPSPGYSPPRRPRWGLITLIALGHLGAGLLLMRFLAPDFTADVLDRASEGLTVIITTPPEEPPAPEPEPDAGAAGAPGKEAVAQEQSAPERPLPSPSPVPSAASTGNASQSGARDEGDGTGNSGSGDGTGSGNGGQGRGGGIATRPSVRSGELNEARDFPVPGGGREARFGRSVTVFFTVTVNGRARDCTVEQTGVDPETTARVCPLVIQKIRFNPATRDDGTPVEARYGYRVDFRRRD
jgi:protein TonB